jgi:hypothetical protein
MHVELQPITPLYGVGVLPYKDNSVMAVVTNADPALRYGPTVYE